MKQVCQLVITDAFHQLLVCEAGFKNSHKGRWHGVKIHLQTESISKPKQVVKQYNHHAIQRHHKVFEVFRCELQMVSSKNLNQQLLPLA